MTRREVYFTVIDTTPDVDTGDGSFDNPRYQYRIKDHNTNKVIVQKPTYNEIRKIAKSRRYIVYGAGAFLE